MCVLAMKLDLTPLPKLFRKINPSRFFAKKATSQAREVLASGAALDKLKKLIEYQGGEKGLAQLEGLLGKIEK